MGNSHTVKRHKSTHNKFKKMELPHIGTHCQLKSCNRLDYLPFKCNHCSFNFCENHWKPDQHECAKFIKNEENSTSTKPQKSTEKQKPEKPKKKRKRNPCQLPNCSGYNLVKMNCNQCGGNFCMKHRFPEDHQCIGRFNSRFSRLLAVN